MQAIFAFLFGLVVPNNPASVLNFFDAFNLLLFVVLFVLVDDVVNLAGGPGPVEPDAPAEQASPDACRLKGVYE